MVFKINVFFIVKRRLNKKITSENIEPFGFKKFAVDVANVVYENQESIFHQKKENSERGSKEFSISVPQLQIGLNDLENCA